MENQSFQDAATKLSLQYLAVLESCLNVSWNVEGQPVCLIEAIDNAAFVKLETQLDQLLSSDLGREALEATKRYGEEHIQTVGFGIASDFDQFAKLGFLCGERLILWDVIYSRILQGNVATEERKANICQVACSLLSLKGAMLRGAAVVLPHPIMWSHYAVMVAEEIRQRPRICGSHVGLSMALAAIAEGIRLHPYTLLQGDERPAIHPGFRQEADEYYSVESYRFNRALEGLLSDQRMAYLENVDASEFQRIVSQFDSLYSELRKELTTVGGLSEVQRTQEVSRRRDALIKAVTQRNEELAGYAVEAAATTVNVLTSVAALTSSNIAPLAAIGLSIQVLLAVKKWFKTPEKPLLVQAFQRVNAQAVNKPFTVPFTSRICAEPSEEARDDQTNEALDHFHNEMWTEDKHRYLLTLPNEVRQKVLRSLTHDDVDAIVNARQFQADYIGDYIEDVWDIDQEIFWAHMSKMFESANGILIYDGDSHVDVMSSQSMPMEVWMQLLNSLISLRRKDPKDLVRQYQLELLSPVFHFQTTSAADSIEKQRHLRSWLGLLSSEDESFVRQFAKTALERSPPWLDDEKTGP